MKKNLDNSSIMTIEKLEKLLKPIFNSRNVTKAFLFGSFARGTESNRSDIDILIVKPTKKRFLDRFEEFDEIYSLLKDFTVDLLVYTPGELTRNGHRPFVKTIISGGIILYEC